MSKKILVVDDSQTVRQQVGIALTQAGFQVVEAGDGQEGLDALDQQRDIAMIICDVNMPRMNGLEMVQAVANGPHNNIPIVMLTTEGAPQMIARAKQAGAKGWIVKPFKPDLLIKAAEKLTGQAA